MRAAQYNSGWRDGDMVSTARSILKTLKSEIAQKADYAGTSFQKSRCIGLNPWPSRGLIDTYSRRSYLQLVYLADAQLRSYLSLVYFAFQFRGPVTSHLPDDDIQLAIGSLNQEEENNLEKTDSAT
jgi:hypothetical protein